MKRELPKAYEPQKYEDEIYKRWEASGLFNPDVCVKKGLTDKDAEAFSIVLPPPNVTGTLHMGHAAMLAIEDVMVRYHRMKGDKTLWVPGTDHASIATESKVEKLLIDGGLKKPKEELGREAFLEKVKQFAQDSHDTIVNQSKKMGASLDWSREAYTFDEKRNLAVRTVFKKMYDDGLIYRGHRLVNWDPKMQSNVADDEIEWKEEAAPFYYFQYGPFVIGTSRPETKFGDKYVIMHPGDARYSQYKDGQKLELEWINGPIIATVLKDTAVDPAFGSGVMTITPWHDAVDFDMAERHGLDKEQVIDFNGKMLPIAGEFAGMDILTARKKVVEKLQKKGLVVKIDEKYVHNIAINYRGGGVIEPQIREQWFVSVNKKFKLQHSAIEGIASGQEVSLKELMEHVVKNKQITILPDRFEKTYFYWTNNLRDWCISRQIWFGHQIPVWYKNGETYCGVDAPKGDGWTQDSDTLDTWFSSGLWTFSTLGWPDKTIDLETFHPTSVLETGYDILFFWVARMILMTTYTLGTIPFKTVYLHGLVRDEQGRKMSKSLDNIINPLDMIEKYGTDATRLSLLVGSSPGNDVKLSEEKIAAFRNFSNKLWNIARFMLLTIESPKKDAGRPTPKTLADKWILTLLDQMIDSTNKNLVLYNLSFAGEQLREFTWNYLADWYLEIAKIESEKSEMLNYILNTVLKLWHPYMPFVTETIWQEVYGIETMLMVESWPQILADSTAEYEKENLYGLLEFNLVRQVVTGIRNKRSENKIEPVKKIKVLISAGDKTKLLEDNKAIIMSLARLEDLQIAEKIAKPDGMASFVEGGAEVFLDFGGAIDKEKEALRNAKEIEQLEKYISVQAAKLANADFLARAPEKVVEAEKKKLSEAQEKLTALQK